MNNYQPPYQQQPYPFMRRDSTLAVVSLVFGILAYIFLPLIGAITAIITGHLALSEINQSGYTLTGRGMAVAGLILGYLQLALVMVIVMLLLLAPVAVSSTNSFY